MKPSVEERIGKYLRLDIDTGCWVWSGWKVQGYGTIRIDKKNVLVHRWMYVDSVGPIEEGLQIDHLCRNRACANPAHLEPVTQRENLLRSPLVRQALMRGGASRRSDGLPYGVTKTASGRYQSRVRHHGQIHGLGVHDTAEAAHEAAVHKRNELGANGLERIKR